MKISGKHFDESAEVNLPWHNYERKVVRGRKYVESRDNMWKGFRALEFHAGHEARMYLMLHRACFNEFDNNFALLPVLRIHDMSLKQAYHIKQFQKRIINWGTHLWNMTKYSCRDL